MKTLLGVPHHHFPLLVRRPIDDLRVVHVQSVNLGPFKLEVLSCLSKIAFRRNDSRWPTTRPSRCLGQARRVTLLEDTAEALGSTMRPIHLNYIIVDSGCNRLGTATWGVVTHGSARSRLLTWILTFSIHPRTLQTVLD